MRLSFIAIELSVYVFAVLLSRHAYAQGWRWLSTCVWGMVFGLVAELIMVQHGAYAYGEFLVMLGPAEHRVPLWVGMGWGEIIYAATWTAQRLRLPWALRPTAAGVLAVNIDLSLDPIAQQQGFWVWNDPGPLSYYGVPFDNFLGWFLIVAVFALVTRLGFRLVPPGKHGSDFWLPPLCALIALLGLLLVQSLGSLIYAGLGGQTTTFIVVFMVACAIVWGYALKSRRDHPRNWTILTVPLYFHGLLLVTLLATGGYESPAETTLLVTIPLNLLVGFFAYAWVSLDTLFPVQASVRSISPAE